MIRKILYINFVCGVVMLQASEKKTTVTTVDQLRTELRKEREKSNQDGGSNYLGYLLTKRNRLNHDTDDKKTVDNQQKETI